MARVTARSRLRVMTIGFIGVISPGSYFFFHEKKIIVKNVGKIILFIPLVQMVQAPIPSIFL